MNPQLTRSQRQWLHSSVGRASHRYREVTGSNPFEVLIFFFRLLYAIAQIAFTATIISSFSEFSLLILQSFSLIQFIKTFTKWRSQRFPSQRRFTRQYHRQRQKVNRAFSLTWPASMLIYWNKRKFLHKKRGQFPQGCLGTPTWPPCRRRFLVLEDQYGRRDVIWKRSIKRCDVTLPWKHNFWITAIASLSNDAGYGKENWKKTSGLYPKNNSARASRFCVRFSVVVAWLRREFPITRSTK